MEVKINCVLCVSADEVVIRHLVGDFGESFGIPNGLAAPKSGQIIRALREWALDRFKIETAAAIANVEKGGA